MQNNGPISLKVAQKAISLHIYILVWPTSCDFQWLLLAPAIGELQALRATLGPLLGCSGDLVKYRAPFKGALKGLM